MPADRHAATDPYATPLAEPAEIFAEKVLRARLNEQSVRSLGGLYVLGGSLLTAVAAIAIALEFRGALWLGLPAIGLGIGFVLIGRAVRQLEPWSRAPAIALAATALVFVPVGTIYGIYFLYLLTSPAGASVLSPAHRELMAMAPAPPPARSSPLAWLALAALAITWAAAWFFW